MLQWSHHTLQLKPRACNSSHPCRWIWDGYITSQTDLEDVGTGDVVQPTTERFLAPPYQERNVQVELVHRVLALMADPGMMHSLVGGASVLPQTVSLR